MAAARETWHKIVVAACRKYDPQETGEDQGRCLMDLNSTLTYYVNKAIKSYGYKCILKEHAM